MDDHVHVHNSILLSTSILTTICFLLITTLPRSHCYNYSICREQFYNCGELSLSYPFWGQNRPFYCGGGKLFNLNCHNDQYATILIGSQNFTVLQISTADQTMRMKRTDLDRDVCSLQFDDTYLSPGLFRYPPLGVRYITISYNCSFKDPYSFCGPQNAICRVGDQDELLNKSCGRHIQVPAGFPLEPYDVIDRDVLEQGLDQGFLVNYNVNERCVKCLGSEGHYWSSDTIDKHVQQSCYYCLDGSTAPQCALLNTPPKSRQLNWQRKIILGSAGAAFVGLFLCITIFCFKYKSSTWEEKFWLATKRNQDIEAFLKNQGAFTLGRHKFSYIKKMTDNFKVKLGQGGYGAVYKGKLLTDSPAAVKILNPSKGNGEEFINEVASISRTSHVNVVTLLGFCLEGHKKALIYELMPNGSLDKFIYNKEPETIASLSWENLFQIAIGIARGLEYLHRGCNTQILHFDIKPHNILLDDNFCPKISDFGLAKLCHKKESMISMSNARGTMGYIAPELWNRQFGRASHKSNVYSYGMMLLEMVGERENINIKASQTSEIYFPDWVYKKVEPGNDLRSDGVMTTKENEIVNKMTIVGLWCIQTFPNDRPTMSRVIDMLEGSINSLEIPPKPVLSSPARSLPESPAS